MSKNMFEIIERINRQPITQSNNIIFVGANSKAEQIYTNKSCKVIEKNYRYVLDMPQDDDPFSLFEKSLLIQKTLSESSESKIVFVIDSGSIFDGRAKEFTNWLELIDQTFASQNLFNCSCLVIESVSGDANPISELKSLMQQSFGRISNVNLKLLDKWVNEDKIKLINNFSKKDLGEYDGRSFQKELDSGLQKCTTISHLDTKPLLPSWTIDWQKQCYNEVLQAILQQSEEFAKLLYQNLTKNFEKATNDLDLQQFDKNYRKILDELDIQESQIYKSMGNFCQICPEVEQLQHIAGNMRLLEKKQGEIADLMLGVRQLHDPDYQRLNFSNHISNVKNGLQKDWQKAIFEANEAVRISYDSYSMLELNEQFKLDSKNLGVKCYLKKLPPSFQEINKLLASHQEFRSTLKQLDDFCHSNNQFKEAVIKNIEIYSNATPLHSIIYRAIIESVYSHKNISENLAKLYVENVSQVYSQLYVQYNHAITNLEEEYHNCVGKRENLVMGTGGTAGAIATGATIAVISGGLALPFLGLGALGVAGGGAMYYKKTISENTNLLGTIGFDKVEKYYKQLPKDLREQWASINMFPKLTEYLKTQYPTNKIYTPFEEGGANELPTQQHHIENPSSGQFEESKEQNFAHNKLMGEQYQDDHPD